jgi:hypothetical protein
MPRSVSELLSAVQPDPWRSEVGFSAEVAEANQRLFDSSASADQLISTINEWISKYQPCLFGRIAAKCGFLRYCVLTERDLQGSDESIREKIQAARTAWTRAGYDGQASGFIILAISESLARATPDENVKQLALRLCSLYLLKDVRPDEIVHDEIFLEKPGPKRNTWRWLAGINYFSSQGDKRWWQDHRIPAGVAFSVNSVGHMVKSAILARGMKALGQELDAPDEGWSLSKVDSLGKAHVLAMQTIARASEGPSGRATELLSFPGGAAAGCPADVPASLSGKDCSEYLGHYHTDYTVPSEYFRPDILRPGNAQSHILDFTYLFNDTVDNPDFVEMGEGRLIRQDEAVAAASGVDLAPAGRMNKMVGQEMSIDECPRLKAALDEAQ